jgi:hypothetical protein
MPCSASWEQGFGSGFTLGVMACAFGCMIGAIAANYWRRTSAPPSPTPETET